MEFSEYENIEIFIKTQGFDINKCENQIIRQCGSFLRKSKSHSKNVFRLTMNPSMEDILYIWDGLSGLYESVIKHLLIYRFPYG